MKKYLWLIKISVSLCLLAYLFYMIDVELLWKQVSSLRPFVFMAAFSILFLQSAISALKWKVILTADGKKVPYQNLLKIYLIGNFISLFLPSSFGGDLYRIYALKDYNRDYLKNTSSVLFDRFSGLFALLSLSFLSFAVLYQSLINYRLLTLYILGILSFWILTSQKVINWLHQFEQKPVRPIISILKSFNRYRTNAKILFLILLISFCFQSNIVFLNKIYCLSLKVDIPLSYLFVVIPLIYLTEALPISINGLGVRESAFVFFFVQYGISKEEAIAVGILVISLRYAFSLLTGGTLFLFEMSRIKKKI